nr:anaphase-promoting complex subunit 10 [Quercus suber]
MPTSTRRQVRNQRSEELPQDSDEPSDQIDHDQGMNDDEVMDDREAGGEEEEEEGEEEPQEEYGADPFPPPGLKEISSLASWTVSTAKPGNGVAALRSPDPAHFWQSDGPQPHLLSIHFFKLVSIVYMRIYLDFQSDESYTPTKIQFLAGMGVHDMQEFAEMSFEQPTGWIDVDFSNVGPIDDNDEDDEDEDTDKEIDWSKRPVLRAFLVQVRILENHQSGKDTHLRAVQLFARDKAQQVRMPTAAVKNPVQRAGKSDPVSRRLREPNNIKLASWMMEPDLR